MSISTAQRIAVNFWFDDQAEQAVNLYTSIFPNSSVGLAQLYTLEGAKQANRPEGSILAIDFVLDGQSFTAINGGPLFKFNEAMSLAVSCDTQEEVDHYWERLGEGGDPKARQCGWLKDKFGVSWQVVPRILHTLVTDPDPARARRATAAMLGMKKLDIEALRKAAG